MDQLNEATRTPRFRQRQATPAGARATTTSMANSVTASQARAARRREARRDEQAVAAWLRELAGRDR
jgi:hypothetical protein